MHSIHVCHALLALSLLYNPRHTQQSVMFAIDLGNTPFIAMSQSKNSMTGQNMWLQDLRRLSITSLKMTRVSKMVDHIQ
jgi:hypothetical protein